MTIRKAQTRDVPELVKLLANDPLGIVREKYADPLPQAYYQAFDVINANPNEELIVVENTAGEIIGTLQLTFLQHLTYQGRIRAQIEAVRIREDSRNGGIGKQMIEWTIQRAKEKHAHVIQLTTNKKRPDALRFYERLGFEATHEGMKLHLD